MARDNYTCQYCGATPGRAASDARPRGAAQPWRPDHLGQCRDGLPGVQRPQGRPHTGRGDDGLAPPARHAPTTWPSCFSPLREHVRCGANTLSPSEAGQCGPLRRGVVEAADLSRAMPGWLTKDRGRISPVPCPLRRSITYLMNRGDATAQRMVLSDISITSSV